MMNQPPDGGRQILLDELKALREDCGPPSLRELVNTSERLKTHYKKDLPDLSTLSVATLSNVLNGNRKGWPTWGWVAMFVLTCQRCAKANGARPDDPGPSTLAGWHERYRTLRSGAAPPLPAPTVHQFPDDLRELVQAEPGWECRQEGYKDAPSPRRWPPAPKATRGSDADDDGSCDALGLPVPDAPFTEEELQRLIDSASDTLWTIGQDRPIQERTQHHNSMTAHRYHALFGAHGVELLTAAENGDHEAASRLGLLLLCERYPAEGLAWLRSAAAAGDFIAEIIMDAEPDQRVDLAAAIAYDLVLPGYGTGTDPARWHNTTGRTGAETYYRSASRSGHAWASYQLALMFHARGDYNAALQLYAQAAAGGHPEADRDYNNLKYTLENVTSQP